MSFEKVTIGPHTLYRGDWRDVLPELESVDAVITDIPYGEVNRESGGLRNLDKAEADVLTFTLQELLAACDQLARTSYVFCGTEQVSELRAGFVSRGMTTRLCVWEKTNPSPMNGEKFWLSSIECCVFARKSKAYFSNSEACQSAVWRGPTQRDQVHPTQKPIWLLNKLVMASVPIGGTCIDLCMGSGTTGVSCERGSRKFIGIENDTRHFDTACKRIEAEMNRFPMFEQPTVKQVSLLEEVA